ncbi:MAG TPA: helix-turn-helix domain-containing protein [Lacipirellulaceae bacterium]|nr:helix-turn-helix domain-containing protein [Lacipirellulaceae bacterium]
MIHAPDDRLLRVEDVAELLSIHPKHFRRIESEGHVGPGRVKLCRRRTVRFSQREVFAWLAERTPSGDLLPRAQWRERWAALLAAEAAARAVELPPRVEPTPANVHQPNALRLAQL